MTDVYLSSAVLFVIMMLGFGCSVYLIIKAVEKTTGPLTNVGKGLIGAVIFFLLSLAYSAVKYREIQEMDDTIEVLQQVLEATPNQFDQ